MRACGEVNEKTTTVCVMPFPHGGDHIGRGEAWTTGCPWHQFGDALDCGKPADGGSPWCAEHHALVRPEQDHAWQHAACLSIAEGHPGWDVPTTNDSLAMIAVRNLRRQLVDTREVISELHTTLGKNILDASQ